jgi:hypothetical protein
MKWQRQWFQMIGLVLIIAFLTSGAWMIVSAVRPAAAPTDSPDPANSPGVSESPAPSPTAINPLEGGWLNWFRELFTRLN